MTKNESNKTNNWKPSDLCACYLVQQVVGEAFIVNFPILSAKIEKLNKVYHKKPKRKELHFDTFSIFSIFHFSTVNIILLKK